MSLTEKELRDLIKDAADIEKISSISSDGRNLLTRIPKKIRVKLNLKKGDKFRWLVRGEEIKIILDKNAQKED